MIKTTSIFAYPTESFYAIGADATDAKAIKQIFKIKGREPGKPIALIAGDLKQVKKFFYLSASELKLARKYWPPLGAARGRRGAVTILLKPKKAIAADALFPTTPSRHSARHPSLFRRGYKRIGVRVPAHTRARKLALNMGAPITATSANISGQPPTKSSREVQKDFPGILVMPGRCGGATQPSTVVRLDQGKISVVRSGSVKIS